MESDRLLGRSSYSSDGKVCDFGVWSGWRKGFGGAILPATKNEVGGNKVDRKKGKGRTGKEL
jgi:hypothetical protein